MNHNYLSVACFHEDHLTCHPSACEQCRQPCVCPCHVTPLSTSLVEREVRARRVLYARAVGGAQRL